MSILNNLYDPVPMPCKNYEDNSMYLDDARGLLTLVNVNKLREIVAEQLHLTFKTAQDHDASAEDFLKQVEKLREIAKIYAQVDRIKNQKID